MNGVGKSASRQVGKYARRVTSRQVGNKSASRQANARWSANRWVASRHVGIDASSGCFVRIGATERVIKCSLTFMPRAEMPELAAETTQSHASRVNDSMMARAHATVMPRAHATIKGSCQITTTAPDQVNAKALARKLLGSMTLLKRPSVHARCCP